MSSDSSNKVIKAGIGYLIGNYLLKGITFLSVPIFSRLLSPDDFGKFNIYVTYESIIYILLGLTLHTSINNAKYEYKEKIYSYISSIIALISFSLFAWLIFTNIFYEEYENQFGFSRIVLNILLFHCFGVALLQVYNVYISLNYSVKSFLKISYFNALVNLGLSVFLIATVLSDDRCLGRIIGMATPLICIGVYIIFYFWKKAKPSINREYWKYGLKYSIPTIPHGLSQIILASFDKIMIDDMIGAYETGIYSCAYTINLLLQVAVSSLENVWKPWVYERMNQKDYSSIKKQGSNYAFGIAIYTILIMMVSPEIVKLLIAKEYWNSINCVIPVLLGAYFSFMYSLPVAIEYFYSKTKLIALGTVLAAALNIGLNYLLIPKYGYIAAAYTTLFTYILYFIFHYLFAKKIHGYSVFSSWYMILISIGIIGAGILTMVLLPFWYIRWILEIALGIYFVMWGNRHFNFVSRIKKKFMCK